MLNDGPGTEDLSIRTSHLCKNVIVYFQESPMRMIIDGDENQDAFHILDVRCTIVRPDTSARDEPRSRERREGMYKKDKVPERDENGKLITGAEVNNTGLDENGNLVKDKIFDVDIGMTVNVPFADNGLYIFCHFRKFYQQWEW